MRLLFANAPLPRTLPNRKPKSGRTVVALANLSLLDLQLVLGAGATAVHERDSSSRDELFSINFKAVSRLRQ